MEPMKHFTLTCLETPDTDRGVGLAIVMETPNGKTWLYDAGCGYPEDDGWSGDFNAGRDIVAPFLRERGVKKLDGVLISHAHYDHFGGLLWLADNLEIGALVDTGYEFEGDCDAGYSREIADYVELRERLKAKGVKYKAASAGDAIEMDDSLSVEAIAPPKGHFTDPGSVAKRHPNDPSAHYMLNLNSLMLRIVHGRVVFLLPGDIEKEDQEERLLPFVPKEKLRCDVLVAPGHGLHTAPGFVAATRPAITLVSVFPKYLGSCTALKEFAAAGSEVFATGVRGSVSAISDGERPWVSIAGKRFASSKAEAAKDAKERSA